MSNILSVINNNTCLGCSICVGDCPIDIIHITSNQGFLRPSLNDNECLSKCTICLDVCPILPNKQLETKNDNIDYYVSYSKNTDIRKQGQSGGFITQVLIELFNMDKIDCAVVSYLDSIDFHNRSIIIDKTMNYKEKLQKCSGSKYTSSYIKEGFFKDLKKYKSIAFVGLPCQLEALSQISYLKKKIYCKIGLVCDRVMSESFSHLFIDKNTTGFKYRSKEKNGYPGDIQIKFDNKSDKTIDKKIRHRLKFLYSQPQCFSCSDKNAAYADVVVGDNYIKRYKEDKIGTSIVEDRMGLLKKLFFETINLESITADEYNSSVRLNRKKELTYKFKSSKIFKFISFYISPLFHHKFIPLPFKVLVSVFLKRIVEKIYKVKL